MCGNTTAGNTAAGNTAAGVTAAGNATISTTMIGNMRSGQGDGVQRGFARSLVPGFESARRKRARGVVGILLVGAVHAYAAPLANDAFDVNGMVKSCQTDADCKAGETGPDPQTVCRDSTGDGVANACYVARQRYLSIRPNPQTVGMQHAYRVSLMTGTAGTVALGFIGVPTDHPGLGPGPSLFHVVRIEDTAHYMDWNTLSTGVISIADCEVSIGHEYLIQSIEFGLDTEDEGNYSAGLLLPTSRHFGDVTGGGNPGGPPNGATGTLVDVFATIRGAQATQNEPRDWLDVDPVSGVAVPNMVVGLADTFAIVIAFQQQPYPGAAPLDCP